MEHDPTITITCDHFVVFTDDASQPTPTDPEIMHVPPLEIRLMHKVRKREEL